MKLSVIFSFLIILLLFFFTNNIYSGEYPKTDKDYKEFISELRCVTNNEDDNILLDGVLNSETLEQKINNLRLFFIRVASITFEEGWRRFEFIKKEFGSLKTDHRGRIYMLFGKWERREEKCLLIPGSGSQLVYNIFQYQRNDGLWEFRFVKDRFGDFVLDVASRN